MPKPDIEATDPPPLFQAAKVRLWARCQFRVPTHCEHYDVRSQARLM
jgi:hypothetical protein